MFDVLKIYSIKVIINCNLNKLVTMIRCLQITKPAASIASEIIPAVNPADFIDVDMTCVKEVSF